MSQRPNTTPLFLSLPQRLELTYQQLAHHTAIETVNRYRDEDRLRDWDSICDRLVDHYWKLDGQLKRPIKDFR